MTHVGEFDFHIVKGEDWTRTIEATDVNGDDIDHTGYTVEMDVRTDVNADSELLALSTSSGEITINGDGHIEITVDSNTSEDLDFDEGVYDLKVTDTSGKSEFYLRGDFIVDEGVTR